MTKSIQSEAMTLAWSLYQNRTELSFEERYEDLDVYDFSEVLAFSWAEVKENRKAQSEKDEQKSWMVAIGNKILDESGISLEEYLSTDLTFVTSNKMNTANLFATTDGRQVWLSARQEEMVSAYARFSK